MSLRARYCAALPFADFLRDVETNTELWRAIAQRAEVPTAAIARARAIRGRWQLLVLVEDWCGDAINTVPVLAKLGEMVENVDVRVLSRDANLDLMDAHLSGTGARAIPVVIALDADFVERGWWGSRPAPLQRWVETTGSALSKEERYREVRRWYARDRGATMLDEILGLLEQAAGARHAA